MAASARERQAVALVGWLLFVALIAPLLVFISLLGVRAGVWDFAFGYGVLTRQVGLWAAIVGLAAALVAVVVALRAPRQAGLYALIAVVASAATLGLLWCHGQQATVAGPGWDVSTDPLDSPGFSPVLTAARRQAGAAASPTPSACPGLEPLNAQVAPEVAGWALKQAGFRVRGFGVGRSDGVREGTWFGLTHDAVVRIRPGRTDVRVSGRQNHADAGEACRLARRIVSELQANP